MPLLRKISVIGLGYVGLQVAVGFGKLAHTIAFDTNKKRVEELSSGFDRINEVSAKDLDLSEVTYTNNPEDLRKADFHIIAVPTPVNKAKVPDFTPLCEASTIVGRILKKGDIVVYESTVYPGATEEICLPILEKESGLKGGDDFKIGYSPERINPSDQDRQFAKIVKVVSGMDQETLEIVATAYEAAVEAGIYKAPSIKVAEAAKVIENTQRDINIALMNELAILFDLMGLDTGDILAAAGSKWNFLPFTPGLVGGHCIGVDPYYLTHKAQILGYIPEIILSGRRINDSMGKFVAQKTLREMIRNEQNVLESTVTVLGLTFKENCSDLRNSRVVDLIRELEGYGIKVQVHDPLADPKEALREYGLSISSDLKELPKTKTTVLAVPHHEYIQMLPKDFVELSTSPPSIIIDVKSILDRKTFLEAGIKLYRL